MISFNEMSDMSGYGWLVNGIYWKQLLDSVKQFTIVTKNRNLDLEFETSLWRSTPNLIVIWIVLYSIHRSIHDFLGLNMLQVTSDVTERTIWCPSTVICHKTRCYRIGQTRGSFGSELINCF